MIIPGQFGFNCRSGFREEAFRNIFPIGSNVKLSSAVAGPYGENVSKRFFSETTSTIETKLPWNDHWKVLYKIYVFYADRKSKMAATAGHSFYIGPIGSFYNRLGHLQHKQQWLHMKYAV
jgi:hypothetical protein